MGRWPSILTALFTGLTALFAGFLWWETLTHDTLALKPSVDFYIGDDPDTPPVGISITNSGPGPALFKYVTFFVDRKPVQDAEEAGITYAKLSKAELDWYELESDDTLAVNETQWTSSTNISPLKSVFVQSGEVVPPNALQKVGVGDARMKSEPGPPMTLGGVAAARVRLIVWCRDCRHQVEPDPAEMAARYGATTSVLDWRDRLVCSKCGSHQIDMVVTGERR